ncbi:hypothetical protein FOL47_001777 [Perkinsus chesapeaki]|uniref:Uncharacterized protein n=1 Tax=Perkinsus chesapeaki TaxID=330153 RepID=A0A7J6MH69_PERCH|nr:hypothetical protein FOL47_001777 [Perkinsus chesapeaki]
MPYMKLPSYMIGIILLITPTLVISGAVRLPYGYYCADQASEEESNIRFAFEDFGVPSDCQDCRSGAIHVLKHNRTARTSKGDYVDFWYTLNYTDDVFKANILAGEDLERVKRLLSRLNLSSTIWDDGLPFMPGGPFDEDSLIIPVTKEVNATLTYTNCGRGLTRKAHLGYCSAPTSKYLYDVRLQFSSSDCTPLVGRLDFVQKKSGGARLERIGSVGWQLSGIEGLSRITLFKTYGTDLVEFLSLDSLGSNTALRSYDYWFNGEPIWYDFQFDMVLVYLDRIVELFPC